MFHTGWINLHEKQGGETPDALCLRNSVNTRPMLTTCNSRARVHFIRSPKRKKKITLYAPCIYIKLACNYSIEKKGERKMEKQEGEGSVGLACERIFFRELRGRDEKAKRSPRFFTAWPTTRGDSMHNLWVERKNVPSVLRGLAWSN